jgi:hypothetical protein
MTTDPFTGRAETSRRRLLGAALAAGIALPIGLTRPAWADPGGPVRLKLPRPTGPYPVGTTALHLIDKARPDPVAGPGHFRELMTSVWYPARNVGRHPPAPWMSPAPMRGLLASGDFAEDAALAPVTAGHLGAPVRSTIGRLTVPLFELPMYRGTSRGTSGSSSTASRTWPPAAIPMSTTSRCRPGWVPPSTWTGSACSAGRRVRRRPLWSWAPTRGSGRG